MTTYEMIAMIQRMANDLTSIKGKLEHIYSYESTLKNMEDLLVYLKTRSKDS